MSQGWLQGFWLEQIYQAAFFWEGDGSCSILNMPTLRGLWSSWVVTDYVSLEFKGAVQAGDLFGDIKARSLGGISKEYRWKGAPRSELGLPQHWESGKKSRNQQRGLRKGWGGGRVCYSGTQMEWVFKEVTWVQKRKPRWLIRIWRVVCVAIKHILVKWKCNHLVM